MSASKQNGVLSLATIRLCTIRVKHAEHDRASEVIFRARHSGGWIFADSNSAAVSVGVATRARARALKPLPFRYATRSSASSSVVNGHVAGGGGDSAAAEGCGRPQCGMGGCAGLG